MKSSYRGIEALVLAAILVVSAAPATAQSLDPAASMDMLGVADQGSTGAVAQPAAAAAPAPAVSQPKPAAGAGWQDVAVDLSGGPYLNARARLVVLRNGKRESITISSATTDRLVDALQKVRREGLKVVEMELKGHGAPELQSLGGGTFMIATGRDVIVQTKNGKDLTITSLLAETLASNAKINLNGCKTGRGDDSVAQNLSRALPGRAVSGGSLYQMGIPFTSKSWGTKRYFTNGQQDSKWWYVVD